MADRPSRYATRPYAYDRYARGGYDEDYDDYAARRIAAARASGYLVIRSRTYAMPDGSRYRSFERPYSFGGDYD